jgi:DNA-binding transcriptional ArsR family regulator
VFMKEFVAITKALSDPHRVRALFALRNGELCVCQIIELFGLAPSTVSKHMSILRQAGLVRCRKEERWMYYRLPDKKGIPTMVQNMFSWVFNGLGEDDTIAQDQKALAQIRNQDLLKLCKMQRKK